MLCSYSRTGGSPPSDDERLEIEDDGAFRLWRTNSETAAGAFGGRLPAEEVKLIQAVVEQLKPPELDVAGPVRGAALEQVAAAGEAITAPSGTPLPNGWAELAEHLRRLVLDGVDHPVAALQASLADGGGTLVLELAGTEPLDVDLSRGTVQVDVVGEHSAGGRWTGTLADPTEDDGSDLLSIDMFEDPSTPSPWARDPGWRVERALPHGLDAGDGALVATARAWISWQGDEATVTLRPSWPPRRP